MRRPSRPLPTTTLFTMSGHFGASTFTTSCSVEGFPTWMSHFLQAQAKPRQGSAQRAGRLAGDPPRKSHGIASNPLKRPNVSIASTAALSIPQATALTSPLDRAAPVAVHSDRRRSLDTRATRSGCSAAFARCRASSLPIRTSLFFDALRARFLDDTTRGNNMRWCSARHGVLLLQILQERGTGLAPFVVCQQTEAASK